MTDYEVGYKKPPRHSQFKKGISANPKGRRKRKNRRENASIKRALNYPVDYRENGKSKRAPRIELIIKSFAAQALKGDVGAAAMLLDIRAHFEKGGDVNRTTLYFTEGDMKI